MLGFEINADYFCFFFSLHLCRILSENKSHDSSTYRGKVFKSIVAIIFGLKLINILFYE